MAQPVGGTRLRLVRDSVRNLIHDSLTTLGWMDSGRKHKSVTVRTRAIDDDEEAEPNLITVVMEDTNQDDAEMGSSVLTEDTYQFIIDIYAESEALGLDLMGDVRDILKGKFSAFRTGPTVTVYDYRLATPTELVTLDIERISTGKNRNYAKPFQRYWWTIFFDVIDEYATDA